MPLKKNLRLQSNLRWLKVQQLIADQNFQRWLTYVKKQSGQVVVLCYCVDRLQRDFDEQYLELQKLIKIGKLEIHYIKNEFVEHKDMDSSAKFRKNLDVLLANDYRNKISDNVIRRN